MPTSGVSKNHELTKSAMKLKTLKDPSTQCDNDCDGD